MAYSPIAAPLRRYTCRRLRVREGLDCGKCQRYGGMSLEVPGWLQDGTTANRPLCAPQPCSIHYSVLRIHYTSAHYTTPLMTQLLPYHQVPLGRSTGEAFRHIFGFKWHLTAAGTSVWRLTPPLEATVSSLYRLLCLSMRGYQASTPTCETRPSVPTSSSFSYYTILLYHDYVVHTYVLRILLV